MGGGMYPWAMKVQGSLLKISGQGFLDIVTLPKATAA